MGFDPWVRKIPWRRAWQPTLVFLPAESHGQRSRVGYSLWGCKESDTMEGNQHAGILAYNVVSDVQQSESTICTYTYNPSPLRLPPSPTPPSLGHHRAPGSASCAICSFPLAICFTHGSMYMSMLLFQFIPPSSYPAVSASLFSTSVPPLLPCKRVHQYHFSRSTCIS